MKKFIIIAIVIALIGGIGLFKYMFRSSSDSVKTDKIEIETTALEMLIDYESNETAANAKYLNKVIKVSGTVSSITEIETGYSVYLQTPGNDSGILCGFSKRAYNAKSIRVGDNLILKGLCTGYLFDVVLNKCALVD